MSGLAIVGALVFVGVAVVLGIAAWRGREGTLPKDSPLGLRNREVMASQNAWDTAHRAAWPVLAAAAAVDTFHAVGCLIAGLAMGAEGQAFIQVLLVSGIVVTLALWVLASAAGVSAVKRMR